MLLPQQYKATQVNEIGSCDPIFPDFQVLIFSIMNYLNLGTSPHRIDLDHSSSFFLKPYLTA